MDKVLIRGISLDENIAQVSVLDVPDIPGVAFKLFSMLEDADIRVDTIVQNINRNTVSDISFTVDRQAIDDVMTVTKEFSTTYGNVEVLIDEGVAKLSVTGTDIVSNSSLASKFFEALFEQEINILMISTSEIKISCIIDRKKSKDAIKYLKRKFKM